MTFLLGGLLVALAALLAGTSGFGFGLLATPLLLLSGFSLPFVVTINLLISVATRLSVAYRLRASIDRARVALLVGGSLPGLWIGAHTLTSLSQHTVKVTAGIAVMAGAAGLALADRRPPGANWHAAPFVAGFAGGVMGTTTSLIGVPPALLLTRQRRAAASFFADLAVYFVVAGAAGLAILALSGGFSTHAVPAFGVWLPGVMAANVVGTTIGLRLPGRAFRLFALALAFTAGLVTAATA